MEQMKQSEKCDYYRDFFSRHPSNTLYEVYRLDTEEFVGVGGAERNSHTAVNSEKVIKHLSALEGTELRSTVVIEYERTTTNFKDPVFIGETDGVL